MTLPADAGPAALELYESVSPLADTDAEAGYPLLAFCAAATNGLELLEAITRDTDETIGWSAVVDVDRAPVDALGWLAQFVGVRLPVVRTDEDLTAWAALARERIRTPAGFKRGTLAAMIQAAQETLTGAKRVVFRERDTSAYHMTVITFDDQTPDPVATEAAIRGQKPAGIVLVYEHVPSADYLLLRTEFADYAAIRDGFVDYAHIRDHDPV